MTIHDERTYYADDEELLILDETDILDESEATEYEEAWNPESGKVGWALAWLLGVPLPLLLVIYLFTRAC